MTPVNRIERSAVSMEGASFPKGVFPQRFVRGAESSELGGSGIFGSQLSTLPPLDFSKYKVRLEVQFVGEDSPRIYCHTSDDRVFVRIDWFSDRALNGQNRFLVQHTEGYYSICVPNDVFTPMRLHFALPVVTTPKSSVSMDYIVNHAREMLLRISQQDIPQLGLDLELIIEPLDDSGAYVADQVQEMVNMLGRDILNLNIFRKSYRLWDQARAGFISLQPKV